MAAIRDAVVGLTARAAALPLTGPAPDGGHDPAADEAALLRAHLGPFLEALGAPCRDRADIDAIIPAAMGLLGV